MDDLVYPRERVLGVFTLLFGLLIWLLLAIGTFGIALLLLLIGFLVYLFARSALVSHIVGNGVALSEVQFPDLHAQFVACCDRLQMTRLPQAYVLNGSGGLNAFATKFLRSQVVVLLSDVVDAMRHHPDGVRFYIGHELGHLRMKHLHWHFLRWPVLWLPLVGAAYSRARESTCDRHGAACSSSPENAARAIAALAAGGRRWQQVDLAAYREQALRSSGFWMSFHELTSPYPWLTKRVWRVLDRDTAPPSRHALAVVLAAFVPYAGRLGGAFGVLILVYVVAVLAAVAIPAYNDYTAKAQLAQVVSQTQGARDTLAAFYLRHERVPESLKEAGIPEYLPGGGELALDTDQMTLSVITARGTLVFTPSETDDGKIEWSCAGGPDLRPSQVPPQCQGQPLPAGSL
ncbi:MAG TPA: M48 family metallopeptidase [Burkholderiaceae bacterium]|nr:M48 family metallopeptidase [Burkholderiaceae bacterium]